MSEDYHNIDIKGLEGKMRQVTNPIFVPNPEALDLDQIPTLQKMLDKLHFTMLEQETELEITKTQIVALNCAISALIKVKSVHDAVDNK
tara:strand:- start:263 stop:529 length:267 start_codon:yes stop_codon:yes gene_type:complete